MGRLSYFINNIQLRNKLMVSYFLVVFIPVLLVGLLLTYSLKQITIDHATQQSVNNVDKIKKRAEEILKIHTDISNKIYFDKNLKRLVKNRYETILDVVNAYKEYTDFTDYLRLYNEVAGIRLYTDNPTLLNNWTLFRVDDETRRADWFQAGLKNKGKNEWFYIPDVTRGNVEYFSLVKQIPYDDMTFCGMLVVTVNTSVLNDVVSQEPFETFFVTEDNRVIAAKNGSLIGKSLNQLDLGDFPNGSKEIRDISYHGAAANAILESVVTENSKQTLRIVSIIPTESIMREADKVSRVAFGIIFGSLLVSIVLIALISRVLSKRVSLLSRDLRMVALGDFTRTSAVKGKDEIGQLARHFNYMVGNIKDLMEEVAEAHVQKNTLLMKQKEIKLKMLANQVNPHFLYNVLETIRMKAHITGQGEIAAVVKSLGKLLRHNLEIGQEPVRLVDELAVVRSYLDIQKFRFGDKIDYVLPDEEEAGELTILPMIVQPVVENAIIHGLENKEGRGKIEVRLEKQVGKAVLYVIDDGVGMEEARLNQLLESLKQPEDEASAGIHNQIGTDTRR